VAELALDDVDGHALAGELHGVGVAELVRGESSPDARFDSELTQFGAGSGGGPSSSARRAVDDAKQRAWRQRDAMPKPRGELLEPELVDAGLAALVAFAVTDQQRSAPLVDVGLVERQRFGDPQPAAPQNRDQGPDPWPWRSRPAWRITRMIASARGGSGG
jgi:hypothetical protein